jgi:hypothetical protein
MGYPADEREARRYRKTLHGLTNTVKAYLALVDTAMKEPEGEKRGRRLGELAGKLELENDQIRRFALGLGFNGRKLKRPGDMEP